MTTNDMDLDALPPDTLVVKNGRITSIGKLVIAKMAKDLADVCRQADDPQTALQVVLEVIFKHMTDIASRRTNVGPGPLRATLTDLVGSECVKQGPSAPLTGDRMDGQPDTAATWPDRLHCTQLHDQNSDHSDAFGRPWRKTEASA
ncbi:hypothetical protein [Streptomyces seoulensis]|uniref:hypothetical protein n=1 Tax=Streptomyces seoulensis TaxID=73044 RepID=UPI0033A23FB3